MSFVGLSREHLQCLRRRQSALVNVNTSGLGEAVYSRSPASGVRTGPVSCAPRVRHLQQKQRSAAAHTRLERRPDTHLGAAAHTRVSSGVRTLTSAQRLTRASRAASGHSPRRSGSHASRAASGHSPRRSGSRARLERRLDTLKKKSC